MRKEETSQNTAHVQITAPDPDPTESTHTPATPEPADLPDFLTKTLVMTGVKINYYHICKTKLWLFCHNITMEREHQNVVLGKFMHEQHYARDSKDIQIEGIALDFIRKKNGIEVHEVKKTRSMKDAHLAQMKYYLHVLRKYGIFARGILNYPKIRRTERVDLNEVDVEKLEREEREIEMLVLGTMPPPERKRICSKCAYLEYCYSGQPEPEDKKGSKKVED